MSEVVIQEAEHGVVRLFSVAPADGPAEGVALSSQVVADALGLSGVNEEDMQQIWSSDLADMSLAEFLQAGYGIEDDELAPHSATLTALEERGATLFVILRSGAFPDRPVTVSPKPPLHLVATLREPGADVFFAPLPNTDPQASLQDPPQKRTPSDAAMSGRIATLALLVMALLVWLMIRVAG